MTNEEMNTFIAEKVHGWHRERIEFGVGKRWIWFDASGEKQISVRSYSPATNVAQAVEAVPLARQLLAEMHDLNVDDVHFNATQHSVEEREFYFVNFKDVSNAPAVFRDLQPQPINDRTMALAICNAIIEGGTR